EGRESMPQLHLSPKAACPYFRPRRQILQLWAVRDERVARILAFRDRSEVDTFGKLKRDIFQAVDCKVDSPVEQRLIDFLGEESLAADIRQRHVENLIAGRLDGNQLNIQSRPTLFQFGFGPIGLPQCKSASSRAELEPSHIKPLRRYSSLRRLDIENSTQDVHVKRTVWIVRHSLKFFDRRVQDFVHEGFSDVIQGGLLFRREIFQVTPI